MQAKKPTKNKLDGVDLIPFLNGSQQGSPHEYLFWRMYDQKNFAVIHESGFKQLILKDSAVFIYNLLNDISEKTSLTSKEQGISTQLEKQRQNWLLSTVPPLFFGLNQEENYNESLKKETKELTIKSDKILITLLQNNKNRSSGCSFTASRSVDKGISDAIIRNFVSLIHAICL